MKTSTALSLIALILVLIVIGPFITIWALNTVFPSLAIPTNIWTWLAVMWFHACVAARYNKD